MKLPTMSVLAVMYLLVLAGPGWLWAMEPDVGDWKQDEVAAELVALRQEYDRLEQQRLDSLPENDALEYTDATLSDEQWMKQAREKANEDLHPDSQLLPRFLALAKHHPESPFALDALIFVIGRGGPATGDVHGRAWRLKERAIGVVAEHHLDDWRVAYVFELLAGALPSQKAEALLRSAFAEAPDPATRAAAGYFLARYLHHMHHVHRRSALLAEKERLLNYERHWTVAATPYLERYFPYDREPIFAETERLLNQVAGEFSDVPVVEWIGEGPGRFFIRAVSPATRTTYGELARSMLRAIQNVAPGKQAPDIEGVDAAGERFRLSDYRGQVVLLTFSANWCGACVKLYPLQRNLIEKFRGEPFALLSVSCDENIDTLKASTGSGEITWRCWWDGQDGPITRAWNIPGFPAIFLLDHNHVVQELPLNRFSKQEEFEQAIGDLLRKVTATE